MHFFPPIAGQEHSNHDFLDFMGAPESERNTCFSNMLSTYIDDENMPDADSTQGWNQPSEHWEDPNSQTPHKHQDTEMQGVTDSPHHLETTSQQSALHEHQESESDQTAVQMANSAACSDDVVENQSNLSQDNEAAQVKAHLEHIHGLMQKIAQDKPKEKPALQQELMTAMRNLAKLVDTNIAEQIAQDDTPVSLKSILAQMEQLVGKMAGKSEPVHGQEPKLQMKQLASHLEQIQKLAQQAIQATPEEKPALQQKLIAEINTLVDNSGVASNPASKLHNLKELQELAQQIIQGGSEDKPVLHQKLVAEIRKLADLVHSQTKHSEAGKANVRPASAETSALLQDLRTMARLIGGAHESGDTGDHRESRTKDAEPSTQKTTNNHAAQASKVEGKDLPTRLQSRAISNNIQFMAEKQTGESSPEPRFAQPAQQKNQDQNVQRSKQPSLDSTKTDKSTPNKPTSFATAKSFTESIFSGQPATEQASSSGQQSVSAKLETRHAEVLRQVENGAFRNLGQGNKQLVIRLDPPDLGQVSVILQVRGKEVQAVLRTTHQEASHALQDQLGQLRTQLEDQGLRVSRLEVQTQLADSQTESGWQGTEQHNRFQEHREMSLTSQRLRSLGRTKELVQDVQSIPHKEKISPDGLDIFA